MSDNAGVSDELVSQFLSITGSADAGRAVSYLEMSGCDLGTAVGLFMEHNTGGIDAGMGAPMAGSERAAAPPMGAPDIRAPDATRTMRLMDDDVPVHMPPYHLMNAMMEEHLAQSAFADDAPLDARGVVNAAAAHNQMDINDDEVKEIDVGDDDDDDDDDDDEDIEDQPMASAPTPARLSDMFAPPTHIMHKIGGFQGARNAAKDARRWLLVNLQRDSEFATHALNRDVWRDELVENLIREGFIFWQAMDANPEGQTYAERYQVMEYPHIAILDPRTARLMWRKEGWTQQNPLTAEIFAEIAMDFCSRHSFDKPPVPPRPPSNGAVAAAVSRPPKRPMNEMTEDEQLQAAMQASLEDDGNENDDVDDDDDDGEVDYLGTGEEVKGQAEPKKSFVDELLETVVGEEPADGARIQIRMPDGKRTVRKFALSDAVKVIYAFIAQSNDEARQGREFIIMAGYPPNDLINNIDSTIESCKLSGEAISVRWK